jgi:hypothetical protein
MKKEKEESQELAVVPKTEIALQSTAIENQLIELRSYVSSGLLPASIKNAEQALVIAQFGRELGFAPMQSFSSIYVVKGRPSLSTAAMSALLRKAGIKWKTIKDYEKIVDKDGKLLDIETVIRFYRDGIEDDIKFTMQEANTAGLVTTSEVWKKYPKIMLYWRCFSIGARRIASDCIMGLYTTEEAAEIEKVPFDLDESGNVIIK